LGRGGDEVTENVPPSVEDRDCPLGCARGDELVLEGRDRILGLPGVFKVVRCRACGLLRTNPRPTAAAMSAYYPGDYGPYASTRIGEKPPDARPAWRRRLSGALARLTDPGGQHLPPVAPGRLLEIGCASGAYLHRMAQAGWDVEGIEFSEEAAAQARAAGHLVRSGSVETAAGPATPFDLVVGWMVLEHLDDPVLALRKLRDWTAPGGRLVASVPNAGCWELRAFSDAWYSLHLPNHLWHPTVPTLSKVLERGGWKLERVFFHRDLRDLLGSLGHALEDRGRFPKLAARLKSFPEAGGRLAQLLFPAAFLLAAVGQTGRMTIWARRDDD
jgi:SAM-dependent methyltransferase